MNVHNFRILTKLTAETTYILGNYSDGHMAKLAERVTDPLFFGSATTAALLWRGRSFGRDRVEVHYYLGRTATPFYVATFEVDLDLDLDARDRQRREIADAQRSAGIDFSLGGAQ